MIAHAPLFRPRMLAVAAATACAAMLSCARVPETQSTLSAESASPGSLVHASYYGGPQWVGRTTASGEKFDPEALTAAHRSLPFGTRVRVTNPANGKSVIVRINDRGPFVKGRSIDLSTRAAREIEIINHGVTRVEISEISEQS